MNRPARLLLVLAAACLLPVSSFAATQNVGLRSHTIKVDITGCVATTTLEQVWVNYTNQQQEAVFRFRLPVEAAAHDLVLWVEGKRTPAEVLPRVTAEEIYRQIREQRRDPALLTSLGGGRWQLRIFPLPPKGTQKVQIVASQLLRLNDGWLTFDCLREDGGSTVETANDFDFTAELRVPGGVKDLLCVDLELGVQREADAPWILGARCEDWPVSRPVNLSLKPASTPPDVLVLPTKGGGGYFATVLPAPPAPTPTGGRSAVLVLDVSESMRGDAFTASRKALLDALQGLTPQDKFAVVIAGTEPSRWKDKLVQATDDNKAAATLYLLDFRPAGATDLAGALRAAVAYPADEQQKLNVVIVTDAADRVACRPASSPAAKPKPGAQTPPFAPPAHVRLYALLLGQARELEKLAATTGGEAWRAAGPDDLPRLAARLTAHIQNPLPACECKIATVQGQIEQTAASEPGKQKELVLAGRFVGQARGEAILSATADGKPRQVRHKLDLVAAASAAAWAGPNLVKIWAHLAGVQMARELRAGEPKIEDLDALLRHSRQHRVVTPMTAMLVLEKDADYITRGIQRQLSRLRAGTFWEVEENVFRTQGTPELTESNRRSHESAFARAADLEREGRYEQAADVLSDEPFQTFETASQAARLREFARLRRSIEQRRRPGPKWTLEHSWELAMACEGPLEYPPAQMDENTKTIVQVEHLAGRQQDQAVRKKLQQQINRVGFDEVQLSDALAFLRDTSGLNIHVKWLALTLVGVDKTTPVQVDLRNVTVEKALRTILDDASGSASEESRLQYRLEEGVLTISTRQDLNQKTVSRIYDVRDLVAPQPVPRFFAAQQRWPRDRMGPTWGRGALFDEEITRTGSGNSGLFGEVDDGSREETLFEDARLGESSSERGILLEPDTPNDEPGEAGLVGAIAARRWRWIPSSRLAMESQPLDRLIRELIDPQNWQWADGTVGSLHHFNGLLIVQQTPENHDAIEALLAELRSYRPSPRQAPATGMPEQMFSSRGQLMPWVLALIERVRSGKLSPFSSVVVRKIDGRTFAGIGGFWFDTRLTEQTRVIPVSRYSPADEVLQMQGQAYARWLGEDLVVVALDSRTAVVMSQWGIARDDHPDVQAVLAAMK